MPPPPPFSSFDAPSDKTATLMPRRNYIHTKTHTKKKIAEESSISGKKAQTDRHPKHSNVVVVGGKQKKPLSFTIPREWDLSDMNFFFLPKKKFCRAPLRVSGSSSLEVVAIQTMGTIMGGTFIFV